MTGNCLKGTRPLLSFDASFETKPHWSLMKELLAQVTGSLKLNRTRSTLKQQCILQTFSTPRNHPKSQPFFDHIFTFTIIQNRIWFRNFQILEEDGQLAEIGTNSLFFK